MIALAGAAFWPSADSLQPEAVSVLCRGARGRDARRETADAEDTRGAAAAVGPWADAAGCGAEPAAQSGRGAWLSGASPACGPGLAVAGRAGRRAPGADAVSAATSGGVRAPSDA